MENICTRIWEVNFNNYTKHRKKCFCFKDGGDGYLPEKRLFSIEEILGNKEYSNLYLEVIRNKYRGWACWLWNDLGCFAIRVCYIYPSYTFEFNLCEALKNPIAQIKVESFSVK